MNRPQQGFPPVLDKRGPPRVRRFDEQRWLIDNIIRANGIDWDQPRSLYIHSALRHRGQCRFSLGSASG
jgi:hypothetical protein